MTPALQLELYNKLQTALDWHKQGLHARAQAVYEEILTLDAAHFDALHLLGVIHAQSGQYEQAITLIKRAISLNPLHPSSHCNLGNTYYKLRQFDAAMECYDLALQIKPDFADAYCNRGNVLRELGQLQLALETYNQAIALDAKSANAYSNRGNALKELGQFDAALVSYQQAIALNTHFYDAYWSLSLALLLQGKFEQGWRFYEYRWLIDDNGPEKRNFKQTLWLGDAPLAGKSILLHSEQGFGDSLQFCRYIPRVKALGARIVLEVERTLVQIMGTLNSADLILPKGSVLPECDYHCPVLSLPLAFQTFSLDKIDATVPYLYVTPQKLQTWEERLGKKTKPRIGLVWSGSSTHRMDRNRSIPLQQLMAYLPPQFEYFSVQRDVRIEDEATLPAYPHLRHFGVEYLDDFSETAALCALMDLLVSVDTSLVHLAGALGKPAWVLLPYSPDWRWLLQRDDSPWYPSLRLFRQEQPMSDWVQVLEKLKQALTQWKP